MAKPVQEAPDPDNATLPPDQPAGASSDASQKGTLSKMWDSWTSHPSNNAALINFGLQMMQPIGAGQSQMGHFAQAIGAGAEASQRNTAAEEERQHYADTQALKEQEAARKERETDLYGRYVDNVGQGRNMRKLGPMELSVIGQKKYNDWLLKSPDIIAGDPFINRLQQMHPEIKGTGKNGALTKADVANNPALAREMVRQFTPTGDQFTGGILGTGTSVGDLGAPQQSSGGSVQEALSWARANPSDPRAQQILQKYGGQ